LRIAPRINCGLGLEVPSGLIVEHHKICQKPKETSSESDVN
jgi:hypothetical protein